MRRTDLFVLLGGLLAAPSLLPGQEIRARVVAFDSRQPISGATATVSASGSVIARLQTDKGGFFKTKLPRTGEYEIAVEMIGYATDRRTITFDGSDQTIPAFVLKAEALLLDPVEATVRRNTEVGFARAQHVLAGVRLARLEMHAATPTTLARELGLRVKEFKDRNGHTVLCIETVRHLPTLATTMRSRPEEPVPCQWPVIVVDGIQVADSFDAYQTFRGLSLRDMESIEFMTPAEAGQRFGLDASANGALVIWTRGNGPHKSAERNRQFL